MHHIVYCPHSCLAACQPNDVRRILAGLLKECAQGVQAQDQGADPQDGGETGGFQAQDWDETEALQISAEMTPKLGVRTSWGGLET